METVELHTCVLMWIHGPHPCHEVRTARDEAVVPYEIGFADGRAYLMQTKDMVGRVAAGTLCES